MKLPKENFKVKIAHREFSVSWDRDHCDQHDAYGHVLAGKGLMWLDPDMDEGKKKETFLHECTHAFWHIAGLNRRDHITEEEVITEATPLLVQLIEDNPHIFGEFK